MARTLFAYSRRARGGDREVGIGPGTRSSCTAVSAGRAASRARPATSSSAAANRRPRRAPADDVDPVSRLEPAVCGRRPAVRRPTDAVSRWAHLRGVPPPRRCRSKPESAASHPRAWANGAWLTADHEKALHSCGKGSPFERFLTLEGKFLFLDAPYSSLTFMHYVEDQFRERLPVALYDRRRHVPRPGRRRRELRCGSWCSARRRGRGGTSRRSKRHCAATARCAVERSANPTPERRGAARRGVRPRLVDRARILPMSRRPRRRRTWSTCCGPRRRHDRRRWPRLYLGDGEDVKGQLTFADLDAQARAIARACRGWGPPANAPFCCTRRGWNSSARCSAASTPASSRYRCRCRSKGTVAQFLTIEGCQRPDPAHDGDVDDRLDGWISRRRDARGLSHRRDAGRTGARLAARNPRGAAAYLQYTSGSTANRKGVIVTHANVIANLLGIAERSGITTRAWASTGCRTRTTLVWSAGCCSRSTTDTSTSCCRRTRSCSSRSDG